MKQFLFLSIALFFACSLQAQTSPAVTLTYYDQHEILDSCNGCVNPYQSRLFSGVKVTAGTRSTWIESPYTVRRYGTSRLKFEVKSAVNGASARFAYGQVNSSTYPSATRLYDDLRWHESKSPGLYTSITDTTTTTLTNAHRDNVVTFSATQLTHTFNLPATPVDGQECRITFNSAVTTLTISGNGTTLSGTAATTAAVGTCPVYRYYGSLAAPKWIRLLI